MKPIITMKDVNFTYNKGKDNEFQSLININLEIYPEEFIIVFGPSGCGKSTLLNIVAGLEMPQSGQILVFDKDLKKLDAKEAATYHRRQVGVIYQAYNLITSLTVLDNVALPQIFVNVRKGRRERWSMQLLERFGINKQAKKIPTELSGGQQQRIGIARAIVNNPQIVLADEPVGNLDSVSAKNVLEILGNLNEKEKKTIILVTHNPEYLDYGDRILHMKDGLITREVVNRDRHKRELKREQDVLTKAPSTEIKDLMRAYHGLSPEQINILIMPYKAKIFSHHFISNRNMEETKTMEDVIQRRMLGTISLEEFFDVLNRSTNEGGVGFDIRTAEKIVRRVNRVIRMAYFIYQKGRQRKDQRGQHKKISDSEKADRLTNYLLKTCYYNYFRDLDDAQVNRIERAVKDRLSGIMHKSEFYNFLDQPFKEGGVGLNSKTARAMTEEIELVLILGYGIVQRIAVQSGVSELSKEGGAMFPGASAGGKIVKSDSEPKKAASEKIEPQIKEEEPGREEFNQMNKGEVNPGSPESEKAAEEAENKINEAGGSLADAIIAAQEKEEQLKASADSGGSAREKSREGDNSK